ETGFYSVLYLVQAMASRNVTQSIQLEVIVNEVQGVADLERVRPENAPLLALCKVIPQEYRHLTCRSIDMAISGPEANVEKQARQLAAEVRTISQDKIVAYRKQGRS